jgi:hypothetical protein
MTIMNIHSCSVQACKSAYFATDVNYNFIAKNIEANVIYTFTSIRCDYIKSLL